VFDIHTYHNDDQPGDPQHSPERCHMERWLGQVLVEAYPGHKFSIRVYDNGGFYVRDLRYPANLCMNVPNAPHTYSISAFKKAVIMNYGEWLERTEQVRGAYDDGFVIGTVQGAEDVLPKAQPKALETLIVGPTGLPLRTEPRRAIGH
jgi:hypothetical protein